MYSTHETGRTGLTRPRLSPVESVVHLVGSGHRSAGRFCQSASDFHTQLSRTSSKVSWWGAFLPNTSIFCSELMIVCARFLNGMLLCFGWRVEITWLEIMMTIHTLLIVETGLTQSTGNEQDLPLSIVRGDAGCLPFRDAVLDAIHCSAALHVFPTPNKPCEKSIAYSNLVGTLRDNIFAPLS